MTKKYSRLLQVLLRLSSISWQTSTKSMTTKSMLFNQWLKLTNGCKRNSQQVNRKNTENNVSINCLTVNSFLTWATNLPTVRRRQFSLDVSFAKFLKWLWQTVNQTTRTTMRTSVFVLLAISSKTCSVFHQANLLVTWSTNSNVTTTVSESWKSLLVYVLTFWLQRSCTHWQQETGSVDVLVSANCLTEQPTLHPSPTCVVSPHLWFEANLTSKLVTCTLHNGAACVQTKHLKVRTVVL